jgi:hypothetical protein
MPNLRDPRSSLPPFSPWAGFLSYLIPGLGQIYQGRVGKGLLFLVCLYGLFFYGMHLGNWKNVYLPDVAKMHPEAARTTNPWNLPPLPANLWNRLQFVGQFWIGAAAWPAILQYNSYDVHKDQGPLFGTFQRAPKESEINQLQSEGDKTWDLGWVCTVIAGVLNILVIYDAFAGAAFAEAEQQHERSPQEAVAA